MRFLLFLVLLTNFIYGHSEGLSKQVTKLEMLFQHHEQWQGTPYQLGGMSRAGVDCSGFVLLTFAENFAIQLPRTTDKQAKTGQLVAKNELQAGDLLFFKAQNLSNNKHVGVYLEKGKFLHASTTLGATVSDLKNSYWQSNYWKAIRL
ncbi:MAG: NlpC/P60 family protein [Proteobacteria bacterium]|nr:NlpC/P60 family protein [Pseudomonadota bacterium]